MCRNSSKANCTFGYSLVHGATWGYYAIVLAFSSNVLYTFGFSDSSISLFLGISTALSVAIQVAAGEILSHIRKLGVHSVLMMYGLTMLISAVILMTPGVPDVAAITVFGIICMLLQTLPSLANSMGMDSIRRGAPTDYSIARGMGSFAYSLLALVTGVLVRKLGVQSVYYLTIGASVLLIVGAFWYHRAVGPLESLPEQEAGEDKTSFFARYPRFCVLLAGMAFLCISHGFLCNFMYQIILTRHGEAMEQGIATAISSLVELPVMFGFPWMLKKLGCDKWVRFAALSMALKPLLILLAGSPGGIYLAQATQSIGYGLWVIGSVNYAEMVVRPEDSIRAQSYHGAVTTVSTVVALSTGGVIIEYFGVQTMVFLSLLCSLVGAVIALLSVERTE